MVPSKGGGPLLAVSYRGKNPEQQRKIDELATIREAYRHQRRIWLWMMAISLVSSALLLRRGTITGAIFALVCLAIGLYLSRNFARCTRVIRKIDQGLAPYRVKGSEAEGKEERF